MSVSNGKVTESFANKFTTLETMHVQWILGLIMGLKIEASAHHYPDLGFLATVAAV